MSPTGPISQSRKSRLARPKGSPHKPGVLAERARELRARETPSERALWRAIRERQVCGVHFCRQVVIAGRWICDFVAAERRVIVEVDGGYHRERRSADARRDAGLRRAGYRVLRLDAELVLRELPVALGRIRQELERSGS
ncbi:MAG TPA: endonuclease domain-containing protein [Candidatus Krumholzibacteria bacterium]